MLRSVLTPMVSRPYFPSMFPMTMPRGCGRRWSIYSIRPIYRLYPHSKAYYMTSEWLGGWYVPGLPHVSCRSQPFMGSQGAGV